ncbi:hypothetical protein TNCT_211011 [Trichonephila clavata]|uniref:Uncharacterized protein n=1 Tax=Trichonephila clavata TaxID=2740835 RepID=A0A8X6HUK3_TRICU|nr:hypothetical protein TNCT_211011 [Trichonephila clavata]
MGIPPSFWVTSCCEANSAPTCIPKQAHGTFLDTSFISYQWRAAPLDSSASTSTLALFSLHSHCFFLAVTLQDASVDQACTMPGSLQAHMGLGQFTPLKKVPRRLATDPRNVFWIFNGCFNSAAKSVLRRHRNPQIPMLFFIFFRGQSLV